VTADKTHWLFAHLPRLLRMRSGEAYGVVTTTLVGNKPCSHEASILRVRGVRNTTVGSQSGKNVPAIATTTHASTIADARIGWSQSFCFETNRNLLTGEPPFPKLLKFLKRGLPLEPPKLNKKSKNPNPTNSPHGPESVLAPSRCFRQPRRARPRCADRVRSFLAASLVFPEPRSCRRPI
jgi:hypothetical protein